MNWQDLQECKHYHSFNIENKSICSRSTIVTCYFWPIFYIHMKFGEKQDWNFKLFYKTNCCKLWKQDELWGFIQNNQIRLPKKWPIPGLQTACWFAHWSMQCLTLSCIAETHISQVAFWIHKPCQQKIDAFKSISLISLILHLLVQHTQSDLQEMQPKLVTVE